MERTFKKTKIERCVYYFLFSIFRIKPTIFEKTFFSGEDFMRLFYTFNIVLSTLASLSYFQISTPSNNFLQNDKRQLVCDLHVPLVTFIVWC